MNNKFIWNIDQDVIHFVNDFDFETPLEDDYIMGHYLEPEKAVTLYTDNVNIPINIDYFIRLWNASEPDRPLERDKLELIKKNSKLKKVAQVDFIEKELLSRFLNEYQQNNLMQFVLTNPSSQDVRIYFLPFIKKYNSALLDRLPHNFPHSKKEWSYLSEEEVFAYVESFVGNVSNASERIEVLMDKWHSTGSPIDLDSYMIDESTINWDVMLNVISNVNNFKNSKWKVSDVNGWTNWETWNVQVTIQNDYQLYEHFSKLAEKNVSLDEFINNAIALVVGPYNKNLQDDWASISDDEEVEMKKRNDIEEWQRSAEKQFPNDPDRQMEYIEKMERLVYGIMGEPEPSDIANHWIDESKVNWQEIYDYWKSQSEDTHRESRWKKL